jgi:hypothetical protein
VGTAGKIQKVSHNGYTAFFGPWGSEKVVGSEKEDVLEVSLGLGELKIVREEFPYLKDIHFKGNQFLETKIEDVQEDLKTFKPSSSAT